MLLCWQVAFATLAVSVSSAALAQPPVPDPATVSTPDVTPTGDPKVHAAGNEYFYFHKPGVTFQQAYADVSDCFRYLPTGEFLTVPGFAPWHEANQRKDIPRQNQYGLVGVAVASMIAGPLERGLQNAKLRRCLEPRGYVRYAVPAATYKAIFSGPAETTIGVLSKLASGPQPSDRPAPQ